MDALYKELLAMAEGGADHRAMVEYGKKKAHVGWDASEDETMILFHFGGGKGILISPWHKVTRCYHNY